MDVIPEDLDIDYVLSNFNLFQYFKQSRGFSSAVSGFGQVF